MAEKALIKEKVRDKFLGINVNSRVMHEKIQDSVVDIAIVGGRFLFSENC